MNDPGRVAVDGAGNVYFSERGGNRVRMVNGATGVISTVAGGGVVPVGSMICTLQADALGDGCPATAVQLNMPSGLALDTSGNLYIAEEGSHSVRMVSASTGVITIYAGGGSGCSQQTDSVGDGCLAISAQLIAPSGVAFDSASNLYIADASSGRVRMVDTTGVITTVAGNGTPGTSSYPVGALATSVQISPYSVATDAAGNLYILDQTDVNIRKVQNGQIYPVAGNGKAGFSGDGFVANDAELDMTTNLTLDTAGNIYIADLFNNRVRSVGVSLGGQWLSHRRMSVPSVKRNKGLLQIGNTPLSITGLLPVRTS